MMPDFSKMMGMMGGGKGKNTDESDFEWTEDAKKRIENVPAGFMRNMTMKRIERYAKDKGVDTITLEIANDGLSESRSMMGSMMGGKSNKKEKSAGKQSTDQNEQTDVSESALQSQAVDYYHCEMCGYTVKGYLPEECPICLSVKEKFILITDKNREARLTTTSGKVMRWEEDALKRLDKIPEGFMRDMTKWRIEMGARSGGHIDITNKVVDRKYEHWGDGSKDIKVDLPWDGDALERINR
ncbi:MAG: rubredoxin-like domain-containing protein, partial [Candidatus Anammoxibacter sp.]